ncbi:MAG TPA: hypothetical protein VFZ21_29320 [Gemmatimonadaceae bacterium]|jgi:hypothetical protein|nr:hypothetical protein [Gemmatimonadaceae bacterium]
MKRSTVLLGVCVAATVALAGCQDAVTAPPSSTPRAQQPSTFQPAVLNFGSLDTGPLSLLAVGPRSDLRAVDFSRAIDPSDYVCTPGSPVISWLNGEIGRVAQAGEIAILAELVNEWAAADVPVLEAWAFETPATPQYFGYNGEFTEVVRKAERDVKHFWAIPSDDIQLLAMHGSVLLDVQKVSATYQFVFGVPEPFATQFATHVRNLVLAAPSLNGGNYPYFTFNAVSFPAQLGRPDKIVMGDGVLAGFDAIGLGDVAPPAIYVHEFAHQIQFEKGYDNDPLATTGSTAEQTRYLELMADAFSGYYLTHKRGAAMNRKRVEQFLQIYFQLGDCAFASAGHHGTPNQRLAAARFGFTVADEAQKQGHILTPDQFHARFLAYYSTIIAPDAP